MSNHCGNCIWEPTKAEACGGCKRDINTGDHSNWTGADSQESCSILSDYPACKEECESYPDCDNCEFYTPPSDPKKSAGDLKDPLHLLPTVAMRKTARILALGASKYGVYNWRESEGVKATTYAAAIMRHLSQFLDGEDADEESGITHLAHISATCCILMDAERVGKLIDDRPKVEED